MAAVPSIRLSEFKNTEPGLCPSGQPPPIQIAQHDHLTAELGSPHRPGGAEADKPTTVHFSRLGMHASCAVSRMGVGCGVNLFVGQQVVMAYRRLAQVTPLRVLGLSASRVRLWGRGMQMLIAAVHRKLVCRAGGATGPVHACFSGRSGNGCGVGRSLGPVGRHPASYASMVQTTLLAPLGIC
jgi:hypothetical protein